MSDIAEVMRRRNLRPDTECIEAANEIDRLRARIAELERALQGVLDPFHQGQISARPEAAGSVQAAIDAGEAALLKATKP